MLYTGKDVSAWILMLVFVERCIGVFLPLKHTTTCTRRRVKICLSILVLILVAKNSYILYSNISIMDENQQKCYLAENVFHFHWNIWPWIDITFYFMIPFPTLCVCIVTRLLMAARKRKSTLSASDSGPRLTNMTAILISVSLPFLFLTLPAGLFFIIQNSYDSSMITIKTIARLDLYFTIATLLMNVNCAINFILYCISGLTFRKELRRIFLKPVPTSSSGCSRGSEVSNTRV